VGEVNAKRQQALREKQREAAASLAREAARSGSKLFTSPLVGEVGA